MSDSTTLSSSITTANSQTVSSALGPIAAKLMAEDLVRETWESEMRRRGELVTLYRKYYDGDHRAELTTEMKAMLRISGDETDQFNDNYCQLVVDAVADRLAVVELAADGDPAKAWSKEVQTRNRFDGLQIDVHDATLRDADTYVMVAYDNDEAGGGKKQGVTLAHEPAWDNDTGMMVVYDRKREKIKVAIKIWWETDTNQRVNFYYPDRIEKYLFGDKGLTLTEEALPWVDQGTGEALGVPVVAFRNRGRTRTTQGISELAPVIPLQDGLNRTFTSMIMTAELTAFAMRKVKGFTPPSNVAPGTQIVFGDDLDPSNAAFLAAMDYDTIKQGEITPFIEQAGWIIEQIGSITRTPLPGAMGSDNASGESLKQREVGLIGKIRKFQTQNGNAWEDVFAMAARLQAAWSSGKGRTSAPVDATWTCVWESPELRNWTEIKEKADMLYEWGFEEEALRALGYDMDKIAELLAEKDARKGAALTAALNNMPNYSRFGMGANAEQEVA